MAAAGVTQYQPDRYQSIFSIPHSTYIRIASPLALKKASLKFSRFVPYVQTGQTKKESHVKPMIFISVFINKHNSRAPQEAGSDVLSSLAGSR